jgi:predicted negative regulator of RcsB-dependent stress response
MQAQDAQTFFFLKLWPWIEANAKRLAVGAIIIAVIIFAFSFYSWRQGQTEIKAGEELTAAFFSGNPQQFAGDCLKIADDYPNTKAGQRALLQSATALFIQGNYADAQVRFQRFLDSYSDNAFAPQAVLGVAASLDAQDKLDPATGFYQRAVDQNTDLGVSLAAKFALAGIEERQGKFSEAQKLYEAVASLNPGSSLGSEAERRAMELDMKTPETSPAPAANVPFNLTH